MCFKTTLISITILLAVAQICYSQSQLESEEERPQIKVFKIVEDSIESKSTEIQLSAKSKNLILPPGEFRRVELVCISKFPVKWEYLYEGKSLPILEVRYKRTLNSVNGTLSLRDFKDPAKNEFEGRVTLRGLYEHQTGKYVCRNYNRKLINNTFENSSHLDVFVPGIRTFNEGTGGKVTYINSSDLFVIIPCTVSDPNIHVRLLKLNEETYNATGKFVWKPIYNNYEPNEGFKLLAGLGRDLFGTYECRADNGPSMKVIVADFSQKNEYGKHLQESCWESEDFMKLLRSKRLECFCKDSYALFTNEETLQGENRRGNCHSLETDPFFVLNVTNCSDWRIHEFLEMGEDSQDICYKDQARKVFNGTGERVLLRAMINNKPNNDTQTEDRGNQLVNLTVTVDGFPDWANGFKIGYQCNQHAKKEILNQEPTLVQLYPLAHYRAVWKNILISNCSPNEIHSVHVFQPDSLSFEWFHVSTKKFDDSPVDMGDEGQTDSDMGATSSSKSHSLPSGKSSGRNIKPFYTQNLFLIYIIVLISSVLL